MRGITVRLIILVRLDLVSNFIAFLSLSTSTNGTVPSKCII